MKSNINSFVDYDKITDTLLFFNNIITLDISTQLSRKDQKTSNVLSFHSEYTYPINNRNNHSIKRYINCFFIINNKKDYTNSVIIRPGELPLLQMIMENSFHWFMGNKKIFGFNDNNEMIIKGKYSTLDFPLSDYKYIAFEPVIIQFQDSTFKEGIRMYINSSEIFVDMTIDKFMNFYYIVKNLDIYSYCANMLCYVKTPPYNQNMVYLDDNNESGKYSTSYDMDDITKRKKSFFDK